MKFAGYSYGTVQPAGGPILGSQADGAATIHKREDEMAPAKKVTKKAVKKPAAKKTSAKPAKKGKSATKKPAAKKPAAKKPAAKKKK